MTDNKPECLVCQASSQDVPLVTLTYRDEAVYVCAQHLPVLIHHPERLVGLLPGAENWPVGKHD
jgi:hypothetical protein